MTKGQFPFSAILLAAGIFSACAHRGPVTFDPRAGLPRLRGVSCCGDTYKAENFIAVRVLGANQVRWRLGWPWGTDPETYADPADYRAWLKGAAKEAELVAADCERLGISLLIDLAAPPRDRGADGISRIFTDKDCLELFYDSWEMLARRFKNSPAVYAFEPINEPMPQGLTYQNMNATKEQAAAFGRDSYPGRFANNFHEFELLRRQGLLPADANYYAAPNGGYWDAETLRAVLKPLRDFQLRTGKPVYVGEFGCFRWAPDGSAYRWLKDCIAIFEEYGWDWSFHAYRSSDCWDPEMGELESDRTRGAEPTDRLKLLADAFSANRLK